MKVSGYVLMVIPEIQWKKVHHWNIVVDFKKRF